MESFKTDTGADVSIMSFSRYLKLMPKPQLKEVKTNLNSPGGPLSCKGQIHVETKVKGKTYKFRVMVVSDEVENLLGRSVAHDMQLIQRVNAIEEIGCLKTEPCSTCTQDTAATIKLTHARPPDEIPSHHSMV